MKGSRFQPNTPFLSVVALILLSSCMPLHVKIVPYDADVLWVRAAGKKLDKQETGQYETAIRKPGGSASKNDRTIVISAKTPDGIVHSREAIIPWQTPMKVTLNVSSTEQPAFAPADPVCDETFVVQEAVVEQAKPEPEPEPRLISMSVERPLDILPVGSSLKDWTVIVNTFDYTGNYGTLDKALEKAFAANGFKVSSRAATGSLILHVNLNLANRKHTTYNTFKRTLVTLRINLVSYQKLTGKTILSERHDIQTGVVRGTRKETMVKDKQLVTTEQPVEVRKLDAQTTIGEYLARNGTPLTLVYDAPRDKERSPEAINLIATKLADIFSR